MAGTVLANYVANWDGSTWSALGSGIKLSGLCACSERDEPLCGGTLHNGRRGPGQLHRQMGRQHLVRAGLRDEWRECVGGERDRSLRAGGFPPQGAASLRGREWDGGAWSALGSGDELRYLCLAASGTDLYAGGEFTTADGEPANRIASGTAASGGAWGWG